MSTRREALAWRRTNDGLTHISIVEQEAGQSADWMEHVSDEQYKAGSSAE